MGKLAEFGFSAREYEHFPISDIYNFIKVINSFKDEDNHPTTFDQSKEIPKINTLDSVMKNYKTDFPKPSN
jgi:hypothetical protein